MCALYSRLQIVRTRMRMKQDNLTITNLGDLGLSGAWAAMLIRYSQAPFAACVSALDPLPWTDAGCS